MLMSTPAERSRRMTLSITAAALVRAHLELLARVLVLVRRTNHGVQVTLGGQRNGAAHTRAGLHGSVHDELRGLVHNLVIVALEADPNLLACHCYLHVCGAGSAPPRLRILLMRCRRAWQRSLRARPWVPARRSRTAWCSSRVPASANEGRSRTRTSRPGEPWP